jgi:glutaredoxin
MSGQAPRVVVYLKPGCHLCTDAVEVVSSVCSSLGVEWAGQDISGDRELMARWAEYVPVILVDGEVHNWFRVQPDRLKHALSY